MLLIIDSADFIGANFVLSTIGLTGEPAGNLDKPSFTGNLRGHEALRRDARHVDAV